MAKRVNLQSTLPPAPGRGHRNKSQNKDSRPLYLPSRPLYLAPFISFISPGAEVCRVRFLR